MVIKSEVSIVAGAAGGAAGAWLQAAGVATAAGISKFGRC